MTQELVDKDGQPVQQRHPFGRLEVEGVRLTNAQPTVGPECWSIDAKAKPSDRPDPKRS